MSKQTEALMAKINKQLGFNGLRSGGSVPEIHRLETGMPFLEVSTGGGIPLGRYLIFRGAKSGFKTGAACKVMSAFQKTCRHCLHPIVEEKVYDGVELVGTAVVGHECDNPEGMRVLLVDLENSYDRNWYSILGVDPNKLQVARFVSAEQIKFYVKELIDAHAFDLYVIDSVAQFSTQAEIDLKIGKETRGGASKVISEALRVWTAKILGYDGDEIPPTILLINQVRHNMSGSMFAGDISPGGKALGHYSSVTLRFSRTKWIKEPRRTPGGVIKKLTVGAECVVKCEKNKVAHPQRDAVFKIYFKASDTAPKGYVNTGEQLLDLAAFWGLYKELGIRKSGAWYHIGEEKFQGSTSAGQYIDSHPELREKIWGKIREKEFGS